MKKLRFFVDFDKEEAWLNAMAAEGHLVTKARTVYTFAPIAPGSEVVRIDYRPSMRQADFDDYVGLFGDAGWRHLDGAKGGGPQYFASFAPRADADIFSDSASKAQRYRRSIANRAALVLPFFAVVIAVWAQGSIGLDALASPREWYFTPGLWDMPRAELFRAFVFETPFVLLRMGVPLLLIGSCVLLAVQMGWQYILYRQGIGRETRSATPGRARG